MPLQRLAARWGSLFDRRRLVRVGVGAALLGVVAVPALAAPMPIARTVRGTVGAAIGGVPALFTGVLDVASPPAGDKDKDETATATAASSALPASSAVDSREQSRGVIVSSIARSTLEQGEDHGDAVSAAARTSGMSTANLAAHRSKDVTAISTATATLDADGHGDAVSSEAHTPPPAGENHGQQVSSVARRMVAVTAASSVTSMHDADSHGDTVSTVARTSASAEENHGQQVSAVAHGSATSTNAAFSRLNTASPLDEHRDKGNNGGAPPANRPEESGKKHGR